MLLQVQLVWTQGIAVAKAGPNGRSSLELQITNDSTISMAHGFAGAALSHPFGGLDWWTWQTRGSCAPLCTPVERFFRILNVTNVRQD